MNPKIRTLLYWSPRILAILYAVFISLFSFDVFSEGYSFWQTVTALLIHLVPTYILLIALWIAWRWQIPGGFLFIVLGIFMVYFFADRQSIPFYILLASPMFICGILFLLGKYIKK